MVSSLTRQYSLKEIEYKASLIIGMSGKQTTITNPEDPKAEPRKFAFDYSYWSHDGYKERPDGYLEPSNNKYADQVTLYSQYTKQFTELTLHYLLSLNIL